MEYLLYRSLTGGALIALAWAARRGMGHRAPRRMLLLLWAAVLVRLLLPIGFEVEIPTRQTLATQQNSGSLLPQQTQEALTGSLMDQSTGGNSAIAPESDHSRLFGRLIVYCTGAGLTTLSFAALYAVNRWNLRGAREIGDAPEWKAGFRRVRLYESDRVTSPVSMGLIRPRIILPAGMRPGALEMDLILRHEMAHIRGFHGLWKLVALAAVCMHWFNPLVWAMRSLISRDLELRADEAALQAEEVDRREEYARLLVRMAGQGEKMSGAVSGFGGKKTKERIVSVMKHRENSVWAVLLTICLLAVSVCAFAEPVETGGGSIWEESAAEVLENRETMTRDEFRKWYIEQSLLAMASGELAENEFVWMNIDGLQALLNCVDGDEVEMVTYTMMEGNAVKAVISTLTDRAGEQRVAYMDSYPVWEGALGATIEVEGGAASVSQGMTVEPASAGFTIDLGEREEGERIHLRLHDPELVGALVGVRIADGSLVACNLAREDDCTFTIPLPADGYWEAFAIPIDRETDTVYIEQE